MVSIDFEFSTATRIIFGNGKIQNLGSIAAKMGWHALLVSGVALEQAQPIMRIMSNAGVVSTLYQVDNEPTIADVEAGLSIARMNACDLVVSLGGGSAIDTGKAVAVLITNEGDTLDYLEVVGKGFDLTQPPLPFIAIPTTSGTGAEVTKNAVLSVPERNVKVSLRNPMMFPRLALIDPELTFSLPPNVTVTTGLDALTQLIEPFVSNRSSPLTDTLCRDGIHRIVRSLSKAFNNPRDASARQDMSLASLYGGIALTNAGLGAVHGFAGSIGGRFSIPHGAICGRLLPIVMEINYLALKDRDSANPAIAKFTEIARIITDNPQAGIIDGIHWLYDLCEDLQVLPLSSYGVGEDAFPALIEDAQRSSSMKGNPIVLNRAELERILTKAI